MKLYYSPGACSLAVHIIALEAGIPVELVKVDLRKHRTEGGGDFAAINPKNYVPAVELEDGTVLTEAAALVQWLAERAPEAGLLPPEGTMERVRVREWLNFIATEVHKGFTPLWHPETAPSTVADAKRKLETRFALLEHRLGEADYLAAASYTIADAYAFTILNWAGMLKVDLQVYPRLRAYLARVEARPAVRAAMQAEGLLKLAA